MTDDDVIEVLGKQVKQRRESVEQFRAGGREEMAAAEEAEEAILGEFLPERLSAEELERMVTAAIAETGASGPSDMGRVMGRVVPTTRGRADGKALADLVRHGSAADRCSSPGHWPRPRRATGEDAGPRPAWWVRSWRSRCSRS